MIAPTVVALAQEIAQPADLMPSIQPSVDPVTMNKRVNLMTSRSPHQPITVSQESLVPLSKEQQPTFLHQYGDHLLPSVISQLSFINLGPPKNELVWLMVHLNLCPTSLQFIWLFQPLWLLDPMLPPILSLCHLMMSNSWLLTKFLTHGQHNLILLLLKVLFVCQLILTQHAHLLQDLQIILIF